MSQHETSGFSDGIEEVATEIALWQGAALKLPLTEVRDMAARSLSSLAEILNDFNMAYLDEDQVADVLTAAVGKVTRQATAAAIFTLGAQQRSAISAQLN